MEATQTKGRDELVAEITALVHETAKTAVAETIDSLKAEIDPSKYIVSQPVESASRAEHERKVLLNKWWRCTMKPEIAQSMGLNVDEVVRDVAELDSKENALGISKADLATSPGAVGGFVVPTETAQIITEVENFSPFRTVANVIEITSKTELPKSAVKPTASWRAENTDITQSDPTFDQLVVEPHSLDLFTVVSRELMADANFDLNAWIVDRLREAKALKEQEAFAIGDGSGKPKGIESCAFDAIAQSGGDLAYKDVVKLKHTLEQQYRGLGAAWVGNGSAHLALASIISTTGQPIFQDPMDGGPPRVLGDPFIELPDIPGDATGAGTTLYYGAWSWAYVIADRQGVEVESTTMGDTSFKRHQVWIKAVCRLDANCCQVRAAKKLTGVKIS